VVAARKLTSQGALSQYVATEKQTNQQLSAQKLAAKKLSSEKLVAQKLAAQKMITHLFQSKSEPRVIRTTIYDGPFKHGSPMLTHQEDSAAIHDCFASFHLPNQSAGFSNAI
jgi:lysyl-tRNA synthetase class II